MVTLEGRIEQQERTSEQTLAVLQAQGAAIASLDSKVDRLDGKVERGFALLSEAIGRVAEDVAWVKQRTDGD